MIRITALCLICGRPYRGWAWAETEAHMAEAHQMRLIRGDISQPPRWVTTGG